MPLLSAPIANQLISGLALDFMRRALMGGSEEGTEEVVLGIEVDSGALEVHVGPLDFEAFCA